MKLAVRQDTIAGGIDVSIASQAVIVKLFLVYNKNPEYQKSLNCQSGSNSEVILKPVDVEKQVAKSQLAVRQ